jgi:hypothetical protein
VAGYEQPLDRCPSDSEQRAAFTLGRWLKMRGYGAPTGLEATTDPLQGDIFRMSTTDAGVQAFQCWPHPSNPGQLLVVLI